MAVLAFIAFIKNMLQSKPHTMCHFVFFLMEQYMAKLLCEMTPLKGLKIGPIKGEERLYSTA